MTVKVACPNLDCGASYSLMPDLLGRKVACKKCGTKFRATGEAPSSESAAPSGSRGLRAGGDSSSDLPSTFGRYEVLKKLGQGGMGAVYLARDEELDRLVALKVPHLDSDSDADVLERFRREARAAAGFHHPNFCPIYEVGQVGERVYLAMAFVEGETLGSLVSRDDPMPLREVASTVRQLALALAEAHRRGIIHRDLKPANVMVDPRGTLIIMDFGLARRVGTEDSNLTRTGVPLGTPSYMSPEQIRGNKDEIGPATDIYALGVILYELSTGRRPFEGSLMAIIGAVLHVEPLSLSSFRPELDEELEAICLKAMAKKPEDRYPSMETLAGALGEYLEPSTAVVVDSPPIRKRTLLLAAGAFLVFLLGVIIYVATDQGTLKVEGFDPRMEVRVDGKEVRIEKVGEPIVVRAGEHGLLVTRGDIFVKAPKSFEVRRGEETVVTLELIDPKPAPGPGPVEEAKNAPPSPPIPAAKPEPNARKLAQARFDTGNGWLAKGDAAKALIEFNEAIRLNPTDANYFHNRALAWGGLREQDKELADFDEAIRLDPKNVGAYNGRACNWMNRGNVDKALPELDMALRLDPKYLPSLGNRGHCWLQKKEYVKALADFDEAIRFDPNNIATLSARATALKAQGDLVKAREAYDEVIRLDPKSVFAHFTRGTLWKTQGDLEKALADFDETIRLDPKYTNAYNYRGSTRMARGDLAEALADYDEAIRLDPNSSLFRRNLAWILATYPDEKYRDGKRAVELATKACEMTSWKDVFSLDTLGAALAEAGEFDEAVRRQEQVVDLASEERKEVYRTRLKRYQEKTPTRDTSLTPRPPSKP